MAHSTFSKVDEYGFERSANFDYKMYEDFMSQYIRILAKRSKRWEDLKSNNKYKRSSTLKRFVRKGVPSNHRGAAWLSFAKVDILKQTTKLSYNELKNEISNPAIIDMVQIDVPRTFPDNIFFTKDEVLPMQLFNVLATFGHHNNEVGYCQGLNYIAGLLLLTTKDEESTFWILKAMVEFVLPQYYIRTMAGLITDMAVLDELVQTNEPIIHAHISGIGMPWAVGTTKWFVCLFAEVLPTETVLRIWDCLLYEGSKIIFRVALTLIKLHKQEILQARDLPELITCFKNMGNSVGVVNCHHFMSDIFKVPGSLSNKHLEKLRRKHSIRNQKKS